MYQPIALFIGLRYMYRHSSDLFLRFVSWLSIISITLGVMALVTTLSVMNGFERNLENNILGLMPQALITNKQGSINPYSLTALSVQKLNGINRVTPLTIGEVVLQSSSSITVGIMLGVNPNESDPLTPYLINITQQQLQPHHYNIIIGQTLASQLAVKPGDTIRLILPNVSQFTPIGRISSQRIFTIIGTFCANSEVDNYQVLINQQDASNLMHYPSGNITGWRLFLKHPMMVETLSKQSLPPGTVWKDWRARKGELFQAVHMEKNMMAFLLSLIMIVAAFNIITLLSLIVMEKQSEVAILKTQGLTRGKIMAIFMVQGASSGIIGSLIGMLLGIILASNLHRLMPIIGLFIDNASLPVEVNLLQIMYVTLIAIAISLISTFYPSWHAATIKPAEILRYE